MDGVGHPSRLASHVGGVALLWLGVSRMTSAGIGQWVGL